MKSWKKYLIFFVSVFGIFFSEIALNIACGPTPDPYDYFVSFFHNNVAGEKEYGNFYFTEYKYLFNSDESESEQKINSEEWASQVGRGVKASDVESVMYGLSRQSDSSLVFQFGTSKAALPDSLAANSFLKFLIGKKGKSYREYYILAKQIEFESRRYDAWDPAPVDSLKLRELQTEAIHKAESEKNKFLKMRYYYQACKLAHFTRNFSESIRIYDKHIEKQSGNSHLKGWGLGLKAGALNCLGDTVKSAYYFTKVFMKYPERRVQAYRNFRFTNADADDVLKLTTADEECAAVWAIEGFGNPELNLKYLENTYWLNPASKINGVLLTREINKLESVYLTEKIKNKREKFYNQYQFMRFWDDTIRTNDSEEQKHLEAVKKIALRLAEEAKYPDPQLGYISAAYLSWMQGHNEEGFRYLKSINTKDLNEKAEIQEKIVRLLLAAQKIQDYNTINEAELLPVLQWLERRADVENAVDIGVNDYYEFSGIRRFASTTRNFYQLILAPAYMERKDTVSAALAMLKGDPLISGKKYQQFNSWQTSNFFHRYLKSRSLLKLVNLQKNKPASAYLSFLRNRLPVINEDLLKELTATSFIREHNFARAVDFLADVSREEQRRIIWGDWEDLVSDGMPFADQLRDYPFERDSLKGYSKLSFAREMLSLEKKVKTDKQNAHKYYYRMANGFYNASTYGNSWYLFSYSWEAADWGRPNSYYYDDDYIQVKTAKALFEKARVLSTDKEFKARCTFMLAKCYQKQLIYPQYDWGNHTEKSYEDHEKSLSKYFSRNINNPYFRELRSTYPNTKFFKIAQTECSYLREFLIRK